MPGIDPAWIDDFLTDLAAAHHGRTVVPGPRRAATAPEHPP
jgi:hypothetical protein